MLTNKEALSELYDQYARNRVIIARLNDQNAKIMAEIDSWEGSEDVKQLNLHILEEFYA